MYFIIITLVLIYHRSWMRIDQFLFIAYIFLIILGKSKNFLKDWVPFVILFLGYEYLRGMVPLVTNQINIKPLISADMFIFKVVPTIYLQNRFFRFGFLSWYDYFLVILYFSHFVFPPLIGLLFWLKSRKTFKLYFTALILLSFFAFFTYLIYPAMPPWLASNNGYIPKVHKIIIYVFESLKSQWNIVSIYKVMNPNNNAAMPSLHAAYPWLIFLFIFTKKRGYAIFFFIYCTLIWFSLIYLGEHYVIDVIVGIIFATTVFYLAKIFTSLDRR